jgi:methylated-DNA-[protein]-cysteine S-methyltransferase
MTSLATDRIDTPIGELTLYVLEDALCGIEFPGGEATTLRTLQRRFGSVSSHQVEDPGGVASALSAYFRGELDAITAVKVDAGGTAFQQKVWAALRRIPTGATISYGRLAAEIGLPKAIRAVGAASARNPIPVVVPCHRVVAADGSLWGYGGGLERKRWLLDHEGVSLRSPTRATLALPS